MASAGDVEMTGRDYKGDTKGGFASNDVEVDSGVTSEIGESRRIQQKLGPLRKARELEQWMDRKLGVESQVSIATRSVTCEIVLTTLRVLTAYPKKSENHPRFGTSSSCGSP
jgi:hypothetical protein